MQSYEELNLRPKENIYRPLLGFLVHHGYERVESLELPGQYQIMGDRIKIWGAEEKYLASVDFFGDEIESIECQKQHLRKLVLRDNRLITEDGVIKPGGYLVHPHHGIGLFRGRYLRQWQKEERPFLLLEYAGGDTLFFPKEREKELMPYFGSRHPRLSRLHTITWQRTKQRITSDLFDIAKDLLTTQASRSLVHRDPWPKNQEWTKEIAKSFPYVLTDDQNQALSEVLADLTTKQHPMDRLLTGDVGYGKTEVAIRAAVPVISGGGQVVVLAPTTVLAEQHFHVWSERFKDLPVNIVKISRQSKLDEQTKTQIKAGHFDLVIGTHKLLGKQLKWARLGLLVLDEEQRFGVKQKEHFKQLRSQIDVLSLTATPIPRTLYMGLSGLREMSIIRTAPNERIGVETRVRNFDPETIKTAIIKEKDRHGQIYYVHNRVNTIASVVSKIRKALAPTHQLKILTKQESKGEKTNNWTVVAAVAHGRLSSEQLARVMHQFFTHQIDLLITTSIIEHGLDNPNANTLIVERAEYFGLADLYQLRGRVGRRSRQAYAWLLIGDSKTPRPNVLSEEALTRLQTMADTEKLGSGWSIALKDLEIRGAGTLIGSRQHGNLEAIGLVLYSRLLKRVIKKLQNSSSLDNLDASIVDLWV